MIVEPRGALLLGVTTADLPPLVVGIRPGRTPARPPGEVLVGVLLLLLVGYGSPAVADPHRTCAVVAEVGVVGVVPLAVGHGFSLRLRLGVPVGRTPAQDRGGRGYRHVLLRNGAGRSHGEGHEAKHYQRSREQ